MKPSTITAIAALLGGSFLIPVPAEARNGWVKARCSNEGCHYYRLLSRNGIFVKVEVKGTFPSKLDAVIYREIDCNE